MTQKQTEEGFDCIAFKDRVQGEIYEATKDMSWDEFRHYIRKRVEEGPFKEFWSRIKACEPSEGRRANGATPAS